MKDSHGSTTEAEVQKKGYRANQHVAEWNEIWPDILWRHPLEMAHGEGKIKPVVTRLQVTCFITLIQFTTEKVMSHNIMYKYVADFTEWGLKLDS